MCVDALRARKGVRDLDEDIVFLSAYNEGLATTIRRGAPSASYSIVCEQVRTRIDERGYMFCDLFRLCKAFSLCVAKT